MDDLILFPFGGNAREAASVAIAVNRVKPTWRIVGFVDDNKDLAGRSFHGIPILGGREVLAEHRDAKILACPGRPENFRSRDRVIDLLELPNERFATVVHPTVERGLGVTIGSNALLMAGVVITCDVSIGSHCVVLPNSVISHDADIGDYSLIGSNVSISGGVRIGNKCYVGSGSRLIQDVRVADETLVGLATVVLHDTEPGSTVVGNPGRALKGKDR